MIGYILAGTLYVIGLIGFFTMATDLNQGPLKTWRHRIALLFWPVVIPFGFIGDIYDGYWKQKA
jgi:hypothetical protein